MGKIDILLATYQSANHLRLLLDSLAAQTHSDFRLLVSDDCSTDETVDILQAYSNCFSDMQIVRRSAPSGSAKANFSFLLEQSDADYILFCDADDIWDSDKVEITVAELQRGEEEDGADMPRYVFGDARIVDKQGKETHPSFWRYKQMRPASSNALAQDILCPPMLGCTSGINCALKLAASPVPLDEVTGHDWWLYLVAKAVGRVNTIDRALMSYRIHGANSSQQRRVNLLDYAKEGGKVARVRRGIDLRQKQAAALVRQCGSLMDESTILELQGFADLRRRSFFSRRFFLLKNGFLYPDFPRNLAMIIAA